MMKNLLNFFPGGGGSCREVEVEVVHLVSFNVSSVIYSFSFHVTSLLTSLLVGLDRLSV